MTIRFRYTASDLEQAQRLMRSFRAHEEWLYRMIGPAFGLAAVLGILLLIGGRRILGSICLLGFAVLAFLALSMPRFQAKAALKRFPYLSQEISAEFNDDGVELVTSTGRAVLAWEKFVGFRENSEVLILRRADNHVQVFPKRAFTGTQLDELRNLIGTRLNSNLANS